MDINAIMAAEGPICQSVVLRANGEREELTVDHTPRLRKVEEIIGADGGLAFVGSLEELDVVVVCCRNNKYLMPSSAKLPFPLHKEPVRGDMLLMRSDDNGTPMNFTLAELGRQRHPDELHPCR
eukprot:CAMPEP_0119511978 /NCGR_PEP_ID=MMETSP1344-20130328/30483_1 /TAXON_ID=236787 /ORGANISM="Florenciella parvula, Strain CCMP2471" /LENGTH=123 /DNA_ID=CAMNT_0007549041 /DNA_START=20 /DNA_END=387 /DNA_ORIENTATION=-